MGTVQWGCQGHVGGAPTATATVMRRVNPGQVLAAATFDFFEKIEVELVQNVTLVSGVQHRDSKITFIAKCTPW